MGQKKQVEWIPLDQPVPKSAVTAALIGPKSGADLLHLSISLPLRDPVGMQQFVDSVSDPTSPNYRHFATPEEIGARFGLPASAVKKVADYLTSQGFKVTLLAKSRQSIAADATVAQAQSAFNTTISEFSIVEPGKTEPDVRFAYNKPPSLPASIRPLVTYIGGLENIVQPRHGPIRHTIHPVGG